MISAPARASLDGLMRHGLQSGLGCSAADARIRPLDRLDAGPATHMVVLSIASYAFKLIAAIHFSATPATRALVAQLCHRAVEKQTAQDFIDGLCEAGNLCCGAINRELGAYFTCLGLSPPQTLDVRSLPFLERLGCQYVRHYAIDADDGPLLRASLCAKAYEALDFHWEAAAQTAVGGELEFF